MNKPNKKLFEKNSVIKAVSVLIAVLIWFLVLDQDNPFEQRILAVPLTTNQQVLDDNNLQLVGTQLPTSVDVKIKGRRNEIMGVTSNDFQVTLDLSEVDDSGTKRIEIGRPEYFGEKDIVIASFNPVSVNLNFERIIGKQYPVVIEKIGKLPEGYEVLNLKVDPTIAILEEKESSINKVNKVIAQINLSEIRDSKEIIKKGIVVDSNGQQMKQFDGAVPLIITFDLVKTVPVSASAKGAPVQDYYLKEIRYSMPSIRVLGNMNLLDSLIKINSEPIDISGRDESFTTPLTLILPQGATALKEDRDKLSVEIVLEKFLIRDFEILSSRIAIYDSDATGAFSYRISDESVKLTLRGKADHLSKIDADDIRLSVSTLGLNPGEHIVPLSVNLPSGIIYAEDINVTIVIDEAVKNP